MQVGPISNAGHYTYIGDLNDPDFDIDIFKIGNLPRLLGPHSFPPTSEHYNQVFHAWCTARRIKPSKPDDGAFVVPVSRAELADYIEFAYADNSSYTDPACMLRWEGRPYLVDKLNAMQAFVDALDPNTTYGLVAECC